MGSKKKNPPVTPAPAFASSTGSSVRTPWGIFDVTRSDEDARDPMEPDDPISLFPKKPISADGPPPVTPRELYEMLMSPAANPTRSSPVRASGDGLLDVQSGDNSEFPPQAEMVLSAMEAGRAAGPSSDRRDKARRTYRVRATLRLYSDAGNAPAWTLFTRDIHSRGLGFITQHRLPLGYGGIVEIPDPRGGATPLRIAGTLIRCREAASGWFEGSIYFDREHTELNE